MIFYGPPGASRYGPRTDRPGGPVLPQDMLLIAVGVSGHRTYGSNKPILPDDDDVCFVSEMPLLRKLALKGPSPGEPIGGTGSGFLFRLPGGSGIPR
jgi:hypothetical protein